MSTEEIVATALGLPEAARAEIVDRLMESLPPDIDATTEAEWLAELERRSAELERDPSLGVPWTELRDSH